MTWPVVSYARALTYPGNADFTTRTVEWVRDHGGAPIVNFVENLWYARPPSVSPPDPKSLPAPPAAAPAPAAPARLPVLQGAAPLPGEGVWTAGTRSPGGAPSVYTTFERPDPQHPSVVAGVAYLDQRHTRVQLIAGTKEPGGVPTPEGSMVPQALRRALVATFNSGFKMKDANGGWFSDGNTAVPLQQGAASLIVHRDGTATVGQWGRDARPGPDVTAVRQSLELIVDGGQPVPGLTANAGGAWGSEKNQLQYTWRSGIGVTANGNLVYVGGANMNLAALANALTEAGAVRGMQLDIHDNMVDLFTYRHGAGGLTPQKLLPDMPGQDNRYLVPDQRDFVAVTLR
jgi:Phosphodiester glycosidase